ncbi:MAG: hypothetical protein KAS75_00020 [Planctomycetes bacterium]|nr:hypothetical protein [Planctomycetota bacterium]
MDIPKIDYKDLIRKLDFLKNYSSLLLPAIIGLVAIFLFIPIQLMSSSLKNRVEKESISKLGNQIQTLSRDMVARDQWKEEEVYQQAHERDANQIALIAVQSAQRQLLSYKIFPEPKDISTLIFEEFGQQFRLSVDELITRVNARDCPTDVELRRSIQSSSVSSRTGRGRQRDVTVKLSEVDATILDVLCKAKAEAAWVYANPFDLSGYEFWMEYEYAGIDKAVEDCWYSQLVYWIVEDVIDTIGVLNDGSNSVFTSPVKRLLSVNFGVTDTDGDSTQSRKGSIEMMDRPSYILSEKDGLTTSYTARVSDENVDIVHFKISAIVNTKEVLSFMKQLCSAKQHKFRGFLGNEPEKVFKRNQITVLSSQLSFVDRNSSAHNLYRYGEDAVTQLDLVCEYVFNKKGYDEIKPISIKKLQEPDEEEASSRSRRRR